VVRAWPAAAEEVIACQHELVAHTLDLIVWQARATAAAEHLIKGQAVSFSGRLEPRQHVTSSGDQRVALELHGADIEFGTKPRSDQPHRRDGRASSIQPLDSAR
jgi:single-stranded DNA-binding protein